MLLWILSSSVFTASTIVPSGSVSFASVSRRHATTVPAATSRGPSSSRTGTPLSSQWLKRQPGV